MAKQSKVPPTNVVSVTDVPSIPAPIQPQPLAVQPPAPAPREPKDEGLSISSALWSVAVIASTGLCAYHGFKRNDSVGWGVAWGILGSMFPVITVAIAAGQGFGVRATP